MYMYSKFYKLLTIKIIKIFLVQKAIQESETEWAHNKKLVDLTKKGLRNSVCISY